ncbi:MAG: helix-turn-helix domain-containing protein [Armatimonadota bacterium]
MVTTSTEDCGVDIGGRLRNLRQRCQLSMRQLAERAGVATSYISGVESGASSPTIAMLRKILQALGTDLGTFFAEDAPPVAGPVFRRETMPTVAEERRCYTLVFPRREDIKAQVLDEEFRPGEIPEFEEIPSDLGGYILKGELLLEIAGEDSQVLRAGDAFYIPAGSPVRGRCFQDEPVRLITIQVPPKY